MKIRAYAVCGTTRKGKLYVLQNGFESYAIFEKKKDAQWFKADDEQIKLITLEGVE